MTATNPSAIPAAGVALPPPTARAVARNVRITAMKARRVVDLIRGRSVTDAEAVLAFAPQAAAEPVRKLLASAVANAANKLDAAPGDLVVLRAYVDEGPTWKRMRPRSRSQAFRILKRTSHITIELGTRDDAGAGRRPGARANSGRKVNR